MTSLWKRVGTGPGAGSRLAQVSASAATPAGAAPQPAARPPPRAAPRPGARLSSRPGRRARPRLQRPRRDRGASVDDGWATGWKDDELYPQQSVSKLWVAITALDAVDKGRVELDDRVTLSRGDLTLFHQPIAAQDPRRRLHDDARRPDVQGDHTSDNTANDKLMRSVGGPEAVRAMIDAQGARRDPLLQRRARAAEQDRRPDLEPELFDRQRLLRGAQRASDVGPQGRLRPLCRGPL